MNDVHPPRFGTGLDPACAAASEGALATRRLCQSKFTPANQRPYPRMSKAENPFRYFNSSPEVIRLVVLMYVRFPLSLRNVEDLLYERGIDLSYETVRYWWNRFGPMSAAEIRRKRSAQMRQVTQWRWHLDADPDPVIGALDREVEVVR